MGSSPIPATRPVGQAAKTPPFHGGNSSSILLRVTNGQKTGFAFARPVFLSVDPRLINRTVHPELARGAITRACAFSGIPLHFARVSVQILLRVTNGQKTGFAFPLLFLTENLRSKISAEKTLYFSADLCYNGGSVKASPFGRGGGEADGEG